LLAARDCLSADPRHHARKGARNAQAIDLLQEPADSNGRSHHRHARPPPRPGLSPTGVLVGFAFRFYCFRRPGFHRRFFMGRLTVDFGIDLGTTNSTIAVINGTDVTVIRNNEGFEYTPSAVFIDKNNALIVGRTAKERIENDPGNAKSEFKLQ